MSRTVVGVVLRIVEHVKDLRRKFFGGNKHFSDITYGVVKASKPGFKF